ncbi:hypothetical protein ACFQJD_07380 [Haloplanus sp. GCM10025708]|uniref:DUF7500 family protein n=1 Tax=Haloferacaceae TaxID=1644056 RepID=UPI0036141012
MPPDQPDSQDDTILSEDELDIADEENVEVLDEGRYVVSANGTPNVSEETASSADVDERTGSVDRDAVEDWLVDYFENADADYGFHVTATFDDRTDQHRVVSNDVVTSFEALVLWYAQQVGDGTPVEDVLGILLAEANVSVRYPVQTLVGLLETHDLGHEDTIADLLDAVADDRGVNLSQ